MNSIFVMIGIVVLAFVVIGAILGWVFYRSRRSEQLQDKFGPEYQHTVDVLGSAHKAESELDARKKHVDALEIRPLSQIEKDRYVVDWAEVQSKFVDEPGKAIIDADHLIMEVMQLRAYPVADFEQRAADLSVRYPDLVSNYRAARLIAIKNEQKTANTEELRQAMIYYRSLFEELLDLEAVVVKEKQK